jgi:hypothetical protein
MVGVQGPTEEVEPSRWQRGLPSSTWLGLVTLSLLRMLAGAVRYGLGRLCLQMWAVTVVGAVGRVRAVGAGPSRTGVGTAGVSGGIGGRHLCWRCYFFGSEPK